MAFSSQALTANLLHIFFAVTLQRRCSSTAKTVAVALHLCCSGTAKTMHWFCSEYLVSLTLAPKALQRSRARFHHITPCPENSQPKSGEQKG